MPLTSSHCRRLAVLALATAWLAACSGHSLDRYVRNGDRYMQAHRYAEAIIEYRNAVRIDEKSAPLQIKLGDAYIAAGDAIGAALAYESAWVLNGDPATALQAGNAQIASGDVSAAAALARELLQAAPSNVDAHLLLARAMIAIGDSAHAEQELKAVLALAPNQSAAYELLAELQSRDGDAKAAEASLVKATQLAPAASSPRIKLAELYLDTKRVEAGEQELRTAVDKAPDDPAANRAYADLLMTTDRCEDAEQYWLKVAKSDPNGTLSLADYYVYSGRSDDALRVLTPLLKGRDEGGGARLRVASIYLDADDTSPADKLTEQVLAHEPDNPTALQLKARLYLKRGERTAAIEFARHAAVVAPDAPATRALLKELQIPSPVQ